jgi:hypothetical protein
VNEIKLPVLDPKLVNAAAENLRKDMETWAEQAGKDLSLVGAAFKSYFEQAGKSFAEVQRRREEVNRMGGSETGGN